MYKESASVQGKVPGLAGSPRVKRTSRGKPVGFPRLGVCFRYRRQGIASLALLLPGYWSIKGVVDSPLVNPDSVRFGFGQALNSSALQFSFSWAVRTLVVPPVTGDLRSQVNTPGVAVAQDSPEQARLPLAQIMPVKAGKLPKLLPHTRMVPLAVISALE